MARLVVQAERQVSPLSRLLVVSVVGAEDGVPRTGLTVAEFGIAELAIDAESFWQPRAIDQLVEGPAGVYTMALATDDQSPMSAGDRPILAIAVSGPVDTGWADDRGQTLIGGASR
jgi:hypothetical protein